MNRYERVRDLNGDLNGDLYPALNPQEPVLVPCPCGDEAVWYKPTYAPDAPSSRDKFLRAMEAADFNDNLCKGCFRSAFGGKGDSVGWVKLTEGR